MELLGYSLCFFEHGNLRLTVLMPEVLNLELALLDIKVPCLLCEGLQLGEILWEGWDFVENEHIANYLKLVLIGVLSTVIAFTLNHI